ncbi:MAG: DUF4836 family protein, partial [Bacteroidaceae bacterium]|nr:DUF4836 family protein [Bacteroidaceae bacterium]
LNFGMPAYIFLVNNELGGITIKVSNKNDLGKFFQSLQKQGIATKPVEKDGMMCGTLFNEISYSYDGTACLLMASLKGRSGTTVSRLARDLMNQKEDDCFVNTEAYSRLSDVNGDVAFYLNVASSPQEVMAPLMLVLPKKLNPAEVDVVAGLTFEDDGKALLKARVMGKTDEANEIIDGADDNWDEIDGEFINKVSDKMLMWFCANVKGEWLLERLKGVPTCKEMLFMMERAIDIEQMLKAVDGDIAVELQKDCRQPECVAYAELKNTDFLEDVDYWRSSMKDYGVTMTTLSKDVYQLNIEEKSYVWGVEKQNLFMATAAAERQYTEKENLFKPYAKQMKESKFFGYINLASMVKEGLKCHSGGIIMEEKLMKVMKTLVVTVSSANEMTLTLELQNDNENFLKQLF